MVLCPSVKLNTNCCPIIEFHIFPPNANHPSISGAQVEVVQGKTGEGNGNPLQYSCLENPMGRGAWWAAVCGVAESHMTEQFHFHALEMETATHSSVLAWRIPGTGEPGGLPSMGSRRVGHN